jgi:hypothetical protein
LLEAETEYRIRLQSNPSNFYKDFMRKKTILDSSSVYQFSNGEHRCGPYERGEREIPSSHSNCE